MSETPTFDQRRWRLQVTEDGRAFALDGTGWPGEHGFTRDEIDEGSLVVVPAHDSFVQSTPPDPEEEMMTEERSNSTKNFFLLLLIAAGAVLANPFVKLKLWLKGGNE